MSDAGLLDAVFRLSALAAGAGAVACLVLAARSRIRESAESAESAEHWAATRELSWALVPPALLAVLLLAHA